MTESPTGVTSFVFVGADLRDLTQILTDALSHSWVASYQVGFGPPLIGSCDALALRLKSANSALEKLNAYLSACVYDGSMCGLLAKKQARLLTRRYGPIEAEQVRRASAQVFDLQVRLHRPEQAPFQVQQDMQASGISLGDLPPAPPNTETARFWLHLSDPRGTRLMHNETVAAAVEAPDFAVAIELQVPVNLRALYRGWSAALARDQSVVSIDLGEPTSVARVLRDGRRS